jgi:hypothetical protein
VAAHLPRPLRACVRAAARLLRATGGGGGAAAAHAPACCFRVCAWLLGMFSKREGRARSQALWGSEALDADLVGDSTASLSPDRCCCCCSLGGESKARAHTRLALCFRPASLFPPPPPSLFGSPSRRLPLIPLPTTTLCVLLSAAPLCLSPSPSRIGRLQPAPLPASRSLAWPSPLGHRQQQRHGRQLGAAPDAARLA